MLLHMRHSAGARGATPAGVSTTAVQVQPSKGQRKVHLGARFIWVKVHISNVLLRHHNALRACWLWKMSGLAGLQANWVGAETVSVAAAHGCWRCMGAGSAARGFATSCWVAGDVKLWCGGNLCPACGASFVKSATAAAAVLHRADAWLLSWALKDPLRERQLQLPLPCVMVKPCGHFCHCNCAHGILSQAAVHLPRGLRVLHCMYYLHPQAVAYMQHGCMQESNHMPLHLLTTLDYNA